MGLVTGRSTRRGFVGGLATTLVTLRESAEADTTDGAKAADATKTAAAIPATQLRARPSDRKVDPAAPGPAATWLFDDALSGPVLRVRHGEELALRLVNATPAPLALHWHGMRAPNAMDGAAGLTQPPVLPGGEFLYRFMPPDAGTYLIRPMVPGRTSEAAGRGLAGLVIVEERAPPSLDGDYALLVRDWRLTPSGALEPFGGREEAALAGRLGNRIDVAGEGSPGRIEAPPGARLRLRLVNACNARILRIRFDDVKVFVAAIDGQPTETFEPLRQTLPFAPGSRYDLFVECPSETGRKGTITALVGAGVPLVEIVTNAGTASAKTGPLGSLAANPALPSEIKLQNAVRKDVTITGGATRGPGDTVVMPPPTGPLWTLNGMAGATTSPPLFTARRGQPVVLGIENRTGFAQPIHLHGHVFRLLHSLDDGWEPYWLDTFQVPEGKTLHIAFLADNPGRWMLASSVLERLDTGLWGWFEVK